MTLLSKPLESFKAIEVIELDQSSIVEWFKVKGLIPKSKACPKCQMAMKFIERQDSLDGFAWRCTTDSKRCSLRDGTYLEKFRIDLKTFLKVVHYWAIQVRQVDQTCMVPVERQTLITYQQRLRQIAVMSLDIENFKLGGDGKIVEIDESLFIKVKHNKGKDLKRRQIWVFGMYERGSKLCLFIVVPKRDAFNLLNVIYKFILPGTLIYSDCWKAYSRIRDLDKHFKHLTVNHQLYFVNPENGVHTNSIESVWNAAKVHIKVMRGVSRDYLESYLVEFCWRRKACLTGRGDAADAIIDEISKYDSSRFDMNEMAEALVKTGGEEFDVVSDDELISNDLPLYDNHGDHDYQAGDSSAMERVESPVVVSDSGSPKSRQIARLNLIKDAPATIPAFENVDQVIVEKKSPKKRGRKKNSDRNNEAIESTCDLPIKYNLRSRKNN